MNSNTDIAAETACADALNAVIAAVRPQTMLLLGPQASAHLRPGALPGECALTVVEEGAWASKLAGLSRFDLAFVAGVAERMDKAQAIMLLGSLRDLRTQRLYLLLPMGAAWQGHASHWERNDLIALGMEQAAACGEAQRPIHLYKFDLYTYKPAPEWFNAKYWAHPELWDKY